MINNRSKFSWSFTGYPSEAEAKSALFDVEKWFANVYTSSEWVQSSSVSQTPYGWRASFVAERELQTLDSSSDA